MADIIDVPTYEQIATILSKLATNYSNLASVFYDVFYNPTPADVTFKMYDESGVLREYTIPNRAKDMAHILNGEGNPEGEVEATAGTLYQDLSEGNVYIKETQDGTQGWDKVATANYLSTYIIRGMGNPDGSVLAARGTLYIDEAVGALYVKTTVTGTSGWELISADVSSLAKTDLSNLTEDGENHFANPGLSNISEEGRALFDEKVGTNEVIDIYDDSLIDPEKLQVPTALSTYKSITDIKNEKANINLSDLSDEGKLRFIDWSMIGGKSCILGAPDGAVLVKSGDNYKIPKDSIILFPNGVKSGKYNNIAVEIPSDTSGTAGNLSDGTYLVFVSYDSSAASIKAPVNIANSDFKEGTTDPEGTTSGKVYFNKATNQYFENILGGGWQLAIMALVGEITVVSEVVTEVKSAPTLKLTTSGVENVIVEIGGTEDNWYRLYGNGWVEQGGYASTSGGQVIITFNKAFKSANYTFIPSGNPTFTKEADKITVVGSGEINWMAHGWA